MNAVRTFFAGILLVLLPLACLRPLLAQTHKADSLRQAIGAEAISITRAELMLSLLSEFEKISPDSVLAYGPRVADSCRKTGYTKGTARALSRMAVNHYYKGNNAQAEALYNEVYQLAQAAGDKGMMSTNRNNLGVLYQRRGEYDKAIACLNEAVKLSEATSGLSGSAGIPRIHLGTIMRDARQDYPKAVEYYTQAISIFEADTAFDRYYLAYSYHYLGVTYTLLDMTDMAIGYQLKGLQLYRLIGDVDGEAEACTDLTDAYLRAKQLDRALANVQRAVTLAEKAGYGRRIAKAYVKKGEVQLQRKEFEQAVEAFKHAESLATQADARPILRDACAGLHECYKALKQKENAARYEAKLNELSASLGMVMQAQ